MLPGFKGLSSVRLLAASADALALLRFDMEVQHARAPNNSALPGAVLFGLPMRSTCTLDRWGRGSMCIAQYISSPRCSVP